jgi:predicted nucleotidyltransferase
VASATVSNLEAAVRRIMSALADLGREAALVGGLAVSVRSEPRFTRDVDLAVAATDDADAEALAYELQGRGYRVLALVEQSEKGRLSTIRLEATHEGRDVVIDLLFASSGIEPEIVAAAEPLEVFPGVTLPVARAGHLVALKLLARDDRRRPQDLVDLRALLDVLTEEDVALARAAVVLIERRGFARKRELARLLEEALVDRER